MKKMSEFIETYRSGVLNDIVTLEFADLVQECEKTQKNGNFTISIDVKPKASGETEVVVKFKAKKPERSAMTAIMFATPEGNLFDNDPKQISMFDKLKSVEHNDVPVRVLNPNN